MFGILIFIALAIAVFNYGTGRKNKLWASNKTQTYCPEKSKPYKTPLRRVIIANNIMNEEEDKLYCPHCGSSQLVANKKGFGAGKALTGAVLTGGVGLLAGFIGSGKVKVTCLKCGKKWNPGELLTKSKKEMIEEMRKKSAETNNEEESNPMIIWIGIISLIILFAMILS